MTNETQPLAKSVLIPLGLAAAAAASPADAGIHKKIIGSSHTSDSASHTTTLIISNEEMKTFMKIVKSYKILLYY